MATVGLASATEESTWQHEVRRPQRVLIRVTPDIDIHGHAAVKTGVNDQKFGFTLAGGHAAEAVKRILHQPLLELVGLHCHIGSQVTDAALYGEAIRKMIAAMADIRARHGVILHELNIGGGHGIPYVTGDPELDLAELADVIDDALDWACASERFPRPRIVIEPGRVIPVVTSATPFWFTNVPSIVMLPVVAWIRPVFVAVNSMPWIKLSGAPIPIWK